MTWLATVTTVEPSEEPVTVAEAKAHCRVTASDEDTQFGNWIKAARQHIERECSIRLVTQTVVMRGDGLTALERLPVAPIQSVSSVAYLDSNGATQTLAGADYTAVLYGLDPTIRKAAGAMWPVTYDARDAVTVTAVAGYGAASAVPMDIKHAILLMVETMFHNRGSLAELPEAVGYLLAPFRV